MRNEEHDVLSYQSYANLGSLQETKLKFVFPLLGLRRRRGGYNKLSRDPQQTTAAEEEANHIEVLQQDSRGTNVFCLFDNVIFRASFYNTTISVRPKILKKFNMERKFLVFIVLSSIIIEKHYKSTMKRANLKQHPQ